MREDELFKFEPNHLVIGNFVESCTIKFRTINIYLSEYTINFFKSQNMEISEIKNVSEFTYITFIKND